MDYTTQSTVFKLKKAWRYVRLYGPARTLIKIKGQYHMKKNYSQLPQCDTNKTSQKYVGIIGCGNFSYSNIAYYLQKNYGNIIRAAMDINIHRAASLYENYGLDYYTDDADRIINDPHIEIIFIASNHASHAEYAIKALQAGKNVHIEKPFVVNEQQLIDLCQTIKLTGGKVTLGFNRPNSFMGQAIKKYFAEQTGAAMINWFIAGHEIAADHWYFKDEEGGRVLGNLCHWIDFSYALLFSPQAYPIKIVPTRAKQSDCDISVSYIFGEGSIVTITFSAKGHTFEGVREKLNAHRGNVLIAMDDFHQLSIDVIDKKYKFIPFFRNHGHEVTITNSHDVLRKNSQIQSQYSLDYIWCSGQLVLKTKEALEKNASIVIENNYFSNSLKNSIMDEAI